MVKQTYSYLMDKHNWKPHEIDEMDFFETIDLEFGDWKQETQERLKEPIEYVDNLDWL